MYLTTRPVPERQRVKELWGEPSSRYKQSRAEMRKAVALEALPDD